LQSFQQMEQSAQKALELNDSFDMVYVLMGFVHLIRREHDIAIKCEEKALMLNPNGANALASLAYMLSWSGQPEKAIQSVLRAIRFNPIPPAGYYMILGMAYRMNGQYKEAIMLSRKILADNPENLFGNLIVTLSYSLLGKYDKAREAASKLLRYHPTYSIDSCIIVSPFKHQADLDFVLDGYRKAGIPEHPPE